VKTEVVDIDQPEWKQPVRVLANTTTVVCPLRASTDIRTIQIQDSPDAAKRPTTTKNCIICQSLTTAMPIPFLEKPHQEFHYEYVTKGHRLNHNDIIITPLSKSSNLTPPYRY
jgi:hypothetical protein